jgi:hypothetical protein
MSKLLKYLLIVITLASIGLAAFSTANMPSSAEVQVNGVSVPTVTVDDPNPVDGHTTQAISSNWAFDHNAALIGNHGVPADPGADKYLKWDDDPGQLAWSDAITFTGKIYLTAQGGIPRTSNGCASATLYESATNKINYYTLDFDQSTKEYAQWAFAMPSDWNAGTVTAAPIWTYTTGSASQHVYWSIKAGSWGNNEAIEAALGNPQVADCTSTTASYIHSSVTTSSITVANATAGEWTVWECMRDADNAGDTLAGDAQLIGIVITFTRS